MHKSKIDFTIAIPTYTGQEHIDKCFQSILNQQYSKKRAVFEVVVVIDGPNDALKMTVEANKKKFEAQGIKFTVFQFLQNQGRFQARFKAAELANSGQLLFVDDRVTLKSDFFSKINDEKDVVIANSIETEQPNAISRLMYLIRKKVYGKNKWGTGFDSYFITSKNFESSPKGTTSVWIKREVFLAACNDMKKHSKGQDLKNSSDDTRLLAEVLNRTKRILRRSDTVIYYHPRTKFWSEAAHIYQRGPKFIDYYLRPGTRFWKYIIASTVVTALIMLFIIIFGGKLLLPLVALIIIGTLSLSILLAENAKDIYKNIVTLPLVIFLFGVGCVVGVFKLLALGS